MRWKSMLWELLNILNNKDFQTITDIMAEFRILSTGPVTAEKGKNYDTINFNNRFAIGIKRGKIAKLHIRKFKSIPSPLFELNFEEVELLTIPESLNSFRKMRKLKSLKISGNGGVLQEDMFEPLSATKLKSLRINASIEKTPTSISKLTFLTHLDLSNNNIRVLPKEIYSMNNLLDLSLAYNRLQYFDPQPGNLKNLESINLRKNCLKSIHGLSHLKNLKTVDVSLNQLQTISEDIRYLKNIRSFRYYGNPLVKAPKPIRIR